MSKAFNKAQISHNLQLTDITYAWNSVIFILAN